MKKHKANEENRESFFLPLAGKAVIDMEKSSEVNISTPEFVPSFHSWMPPQQQVEIANELVKMTKRNKGENSVGKNNKK